MKIKAGSPEDRILTAIFEGMEGNGTILTPEEKAKRTCCFMMGYTAGFSFAKVPNEETVVDFIQSVNRVSFENMLKK